MLLLQIVLQKFQINLFKLQNLQNIIHTLLGIMHKAFRIKMNGLRVSMMSNYIDHIRIVQLAYLPHNALVSSLHNWEQQFFVQFFTN